MRTMKMNKALDLIWDMEWSKKKSWKTYRSIMIPIKEHCGEILLQNMTHVHVKNYRDIRENIVSPSTVNKEHMCITRLFHFLTEMNRLKVISVNLPEYGNPGSQIRKFNERYCSRKRVLTSMEFELFAQYLPYEAVRICRFAAMTGLRRKDIRLLKRDNINEQTNRIEGIQAKTGLPYSLPITQGIKDILNQNGNELIFDFKNFRRSFEEARKKSGVKHFRFADLRRTNARFLLQNGVDIATVQQRLGHADIRMTQFYVPPSQDDMLKAGQILERKFFNI